MSNIAQAAAVKMTVMHPFFTELYYSMNIVELDDERAKELGVLTEATDGLNLYINTSFFSRLTTEAQTEELVHEVCHKMLLHVVRRAGRDPHLWQLAADYAANSLMKKNKFKLGPDWLYDAKYDGWLTEAIYVDLLNKQRNNEQLPQMPEGRGNDVRNAPASSEADQQQVEQKIREQVERALTNAKARGNLPAGVELAVEDAMRLPPEPWYNRLHRFMQELRASGYNWARPNRRTLKTHGFFSPSHLSEALGDIVMWIDTSGSCMGAAEQAEFAGHVGAILAEAKPKRVKIYYVDTELYDGGEVEPGALDFKSAPVGGGGSDFREIHLRAEEDGYSPVVGIVLTDMYVRFPDDAPDYPVIWASTSEGIEAPYGETIYVG